MRAPVETMAFTMPDSTRSQKTRPILPTVMAPERVSTTKQSLSRAMAFKNVSSIANLPGSEGGLPHGANEIVDGVNARKIQRKDGSQTIFDRVVKGSSSHTLFLCHSAPSQVMYFSSVKGNTRYT